VCEQFCNKFVSVFRHKFKNTENHVTNSKTLKIMNENCDFFAVPLLAMNLTFFLQCNVELNIQTECKKVD